MIATQSHSNDPSFNLAYEEFIYDNFIHDDVFYLWQNTPSIEIGFIQNVQNKVNIDFAQKENIPILRRQTGGTATYHDLGSIHYTYISKYTDNFDSTAILNLIIDNLAKFDIEATLYGSSEIAIDGKIISTQSKKISNNRIMIHGTVLFDQDLERTVTLLNDIEASSITNIRSHLAKDMTTHEFFYHFLKGMLPTDYVYMDISPEERMEVWRLAKSKYQPKP